LEKAEYPLEEINASWLCWNVNKHESLLLDKFQREAVFVLKGIEEIIK
jgi:hypothetical protein